MARVEIEDTDPKKSPVPYSVVRKILEWESGLLRVTQSTSHTVKDGIQYMLQKQMDTRVDWQGSALAGVER